MKKYFVTATHTDAGKTFISGLLVKALDADYWKPIQSGSDIRDADTIYNSFGVSPDRIFPESYLLESPESPHSAAEKDGVSICLETIELPKTNNNLIIEGAGGILVPINENHTIADVITKLDVEIILVVPTYLGCINHSLLTIEAIKSRGLKIKALIFNGEESKAAQTYIMNQLEGVFSCRIPKIDLEKNEDIESAIFELKKIF